MSFNATNKRVQKAAVVRVDVSNLITDRDEAEASMNQMI